MKITIDGSPQGRTAFFTTPYLTGGPAGEKDWKGELTFPQDIVNAMVKQVYDLGVPLNLHSNGDAAIDAFFAAHELAAAGDLDEGSQRDDDPCAVHPEGPDPEISSNTRSVRPTTRFTPITLPMRTSPTAGRSRRMYISPMRDSIDAGLHPTNHTDFVVAPLDQMFMLWSAVNRISRAGAGDRPGPADHAA